MKRFILLMSVCSFLLMSTAYAENGIVPDIDPGISGSEATQAPQAEPTADPNQQQANAAVQEQPWLYPISREILEDPMDVLRLVNKGNLLDKDYPPQDVEMYKLVSVDLPKTSNSERLLRMVSSEALARMFAAAEQDGIKLYVKSAYRDYRTQDIQHYNRVKELGRDDGVVQAAGASDHQTGLGVDVVSWAWRDKKLNKDFAKTDEAIWMAANCAKYGFIIRYPEGKEDITGIMYESWHLRYVGIEVANYMHTMGMTLEEFTAEVNTVKADYANGKPYTDNSNVGSTTSTVNQDPVVDTFEF